MLSKLTQNAMVPAGFFKSHPGSWAWRHYTRVASGASEQQRGDAVVTMVNAWKTSTWTTVKQQYTSYQKFRADTGDTSEEICKFSFGNFGEWRYSNFQKRESAKKTTAQKRSGSSVRKGVDLLMGVHRMINGRADDPPESVTKAGARSDADFAKKAAKQKTKRSGGESNTFSGNQVSKGVSEALHKGGGDMLRTSGLLVTLAATSGARWHDLMNMDVKATFRRFCSPDSGATLVHENGEQFTKMEQFQESETVWQYLVGVDSRSSFGKHRGTGCWKDGGRLPVRGEPQSGLAFRLLAAWCHENIDWDNEDKEVFFPGQFQRTHSKGNKPGADARGWPTHWRFDPSTEMSPAGRESWMTVVFSSLMLVGGTMDPARIRSLSGGSFADCSFHGNRRSTMTNAEAADAKPLAIQRLAQHKTADTQNGYKQLSDKDRTTVLIANELQLDDEAQLPLLPPLVATALSEESRREAWVQSARTVIELGKADARRPRSGTQGSYARAAGQEVFVLSRVQQAPVALVLFLRDRAARVVEAKEISEWRAVEIPRSGPSRRTEANRYTQGKTADQQAADHRRSGEERRNATKPQAGTAKATRDEAKAAEGEHQGEPRSWKFVSTLSQNEEWANHDFGDRRVQAGTVIRHAWKDRGTFTAVVTETWFDEEDTGKWQVHLQYEDGDTSDLDEAEFDKYVEEERITPFPPSTHEHTDGIRLPFRAQGCGLWTSKTGRKTKGRQKCLARSTRVEEAPSEAWLGLWRLRKVTDAEGAQAWIPCQVRGTVKGGETVFVVCPFSATSGVVATGDTQKWKHEGTDESPWVKGETATEAHVREL